MSFLAPVRRCPFPLGEKSETEKALQGTDSIALLGEVDERVGNKGSSVLRRGNVRS